MTLTWAFCRHNGHLKTHKSELLSLTTDGDLTEINLLDCAQSTDFLKALETVTEIWQNP